MAAATSPPLQPQQQQRPSSSDDGQHHHHPLRHPPRNDNDFAAWRARLSARLAALPPEQVPVVLVACGSFNPPTRAHLRMFAAGAATVDGASAGDGAAAQTQTLSVVGGLLSPVGDGYGKAGLAPAAHRLAMCALAAEACQQAGAQAQATTAPSSSGPLPLPPPLPPPPQVDVCVHGWEAARGGGRRVHTRTLDVLRHIERELNSTADGGGAREGGAAATAAAAATASAAASCSPPPPPPFVRVMLLGGADLVESMRRPGVWSEPEALLREHGVVCVERPGHTAGPSASSAAGTAAAAATAAATAAVDGALLESRVLRAECDEEVMSGVSSSRAREALRAALAEAEAGGTTAATTTTTTTRRDRTAVAAAAARDPRVARLLEPRVAEYAVLSGLYAAEAE